jgi:hypothetical protein
MCPSIHHLTRIKDIGEVEKKVPVHDLISPVGRDIRNLSIVGKLRQMANLPVSVFTSCLSVFPILELKEESDPRINSQVFNGSRRVRRPRIQVKMGEA